MFKTFTQEDSLRYIYNEMESEEKVLFEHKLTNDPSFFRSYLEFKETITFIDSAVLFEPSTLSIALIKSMSSSYKLCKIDVGEFDHFLN